MSTFLVGLVLLGAMRLLGHSIRAEDSTSEQTRAVLLAEALMEEILQQDYEEPDDKSVFGPESNEGNSKRENWDDVDDYDNWAASPPQSSDGADLSGWDGWRRVVEVKHVDPDDLSLELPDSRDQGVRRIEVTVTRRGVELARLTALQTRTWVDMIPEIGNDRTTGRMPPGNRPPTAVISASGLAGTAPFSVDFDARDSTDPESEPLYFEWDFGDGTSASGPQASHTFENSGTSVVVYKVTLAVTDIHGGTDSTSVSITVHAK